MATRRGKKKVGARRGAAAGKAAGKRRPARKASPAKPARRAASPLKTAPRARKAPATRRAAPRVEAAPPAPAAREERESKDEVLELFRHYDRNGSGSIDAAELARLLEALGAPPSEEELAIALDVVDRNRSGKISWSEFSAWWRGR